MSKPQPVVVTTICSLCGQDWGAHGEKPTTEDCIRLLLAEIARRPAPPVITVQPYPYRWVQPYQYWYSNTIPCSTIGTTSTYTINCQSSLKRPDEGEPPTPVAA